MKRSRKGIETIEIKRDKNIGTGSLLPAMPVTDWVIARKVQNWKGLLTDPRVERVEDERGSDDGIWVYLRDGWFYEDGSVIHEDTQERCMECLNFVEKEPGGERE